MKKQGTSIHKANKAWQLARFLPHPVPCFPIASPPSSNELLLQQPSCPLRLFLALSQWFAALFLVSLCWACN